MLAAESLAALSASTANRPVTVTVTTVHFALVAKRFITA